MRCWTTFWGGWALTMPRRPPGTGSYSSPCMLISSSWCMGLLLLAQLCETAARSPQLQHTVAWARKHGTGMDNLFFSYPFFFQFLFILPLFPSHSLWKSACGRCSSLVRVSEERGTTITIAQFLTPSPVGQVASLSGGTGQSCQLRTAPPGRPPPSDPQGGSTGPPGVPTTRSAPLPRTTCLPK